MSKVHKLKVSIEHWNKYLEKDSWSIRKDDRNFKAHDICEFNLINKSELFTSSWQVLHLIEDVLKHEDFPEGIQPGYCVLTLKLIKVTGKSARYR